MKSHEQKHVRRLVNQSADAYEDQWQAGFTPSIVDYLVEGIAPSFRLDLFESLLDLHIFYCDQKSIAIDFEQLKQQFPEFDDAIQDAKRRHDNDVSAASIETNKDDPQSAQSTGVSEVHDSFIDDMVAGKEFGRYRIIKRLGQGAMGVVFEAEDTALSRKVALKIPSLVDNQKKTIERFEREAQAAAGVRHPNVCQIFDVGCHDGKHFLTMELIQGESLDQVLKRSSPTPRQVAKLVSKLCLGIDELHRLGIVHRDLKPSNIMVNREGHPILMDFGLARQQGTTEATELTQPGMIVGSPAYMAPEQIKKSSDASPESDIYSLGIVMYQMLTGDLPFKGEMLDVLQQVMLNDPAAPSEIKPGIHPLLEKICLKAISKDPGDRFQDMAQFASELNHFLLKKPSEETEQRPASIVAKVGYYRLFVGLALIAVLAGMIILPFSGARATTEKGEIRFEILDDATEVVLDSWASPIKSDSAGRIFEVAADKSTHLKLRHGQFEFASESFAVAADESVSIRIDYVDNKLLTRWNDESWQQFDLVFDVESPFTVRKLLPDTGEFWGNGLSYGPFRQGQNPDEGTGPTKEQVREDMLIIAGAGWDMIRIYGTEPFARMICESIQEEGIDLKLIVGAWIMSEQNNPERAKINHGQVSRAIELANEFPEIVMSVCVGNGCLNSKSPFFVKPSVLLPYIREVCHRISQPVTVADDVSYWASEASQKIAAEIDFVMLHLHPFWLGQTLENATQWTRQNFELVQKQHPNRRLVIGETGWPTSRSEDSRFVGVAGENEQQEFLTCVIGWAQKSGVPYFLYEAFDEPFKGGADPADFEKHFGLYRQDRTAKYELDFRTALVDAPTKFNIDSSSNSLANAASITALKKMMTSGLEFEKMDFVERNQRIDFARVGWARTREIQGFNDDQLKFLLRTFPNLNRLEVNLTNASMPALNQLIGSSIEILVARFDVSQPKKFALIGKMKKLKGLDLMNCRLVDEHLSCLAGLTNLQVLELGFNHISGSGLADLKNLARLRSLNLVRTQFGKDQLRHLSNFKGLQSLSLAQAEFDGRELRVIQDLPELAGLELAETRVNSSDLQFLSEMESLARVSFEGCKNIRSLQGVIPPNLNELNLVFTELENLDPLKNSTVRKLLIQSKREEVLELIEANENIQFVNELPIEEYRRLSE